MSRSSIKPMRSTRPLSLCRPREVRPEGEGSNRASLHRVDAVRFFHVIDRGLAPVTGDIGSMNGDRPPGGRADDGQHRREGSCLSGLSFLVRRPVGERGVGVKVIGPGVYDDSSTGEVFVDGISGFDRVGLAPHLFCLANPPIHVVLRFRCGGKLNIET